MKAPVRHLLIFADGRVAQAREPLRGQWLYRAETRDDGSIWVRKFEVDCAITTGDDPPCTMVAIERSCVPWEQRYSPEPEPVVNTVRIPEMSFPCPGGDA